MFQTSATAKQAIVVDEQVKLTDQLMLSLAGQAMKNIGIVVALNMSIPKETSSMEFCSAQRTRQTIGG